MQVRKQVYDHSGFGARLVCLTPLLAALAREGKLAVAERIAVPLCPQPPSVWPHPPCLLELKIEKDERCSAAGATLFEDPAR